MSPPPNQVGNALPETTLTHGAYGQNLTYYCNETQATRKALTNITLECYNETWTIPPDDFVCFPGKYQNLETLANFT